MKSLYEPLKRVFVQGQYTWYGKSYFTEEKNNFIVGFGPQMIENVVQYPGNTKEVQLVFPIWRKMRF